MTSKRERLLLFRSVSFVFEQVRNGLFVVLSGFRVRITLTTGLASFILKTLYQSSSKFGLAGTAGFLVALTITKLLAFILKASLVCCGSDRSVIPKQYCAKLESEECFDGRVIFRC